MAVRGAPAIAIAGALALAVELQNNGAGKQYATGKQAQQEIQKKLAYLVTRSALTKYGSCYSQSLLQIT